MKKTPVKKDEEYIIDINGMGYQGEGVGRIENFAVFIPGAVKGERIKTKITRVNKNFAFGSIVEIIDKAPYRLEPECSLYWECGGCQIQHLSYEGQLEYKRQRVIDSIQRIGGLKDVEILPVLGMEDPWLYRNKVQLPVGMKDGRVQIGFYSAGSHNIVDIKSCLIQDKTGDKTIELIRKWIEKYNIPVYDEASGNGIIRHVMMRKGFKTGEVMVVVVTNGISLPYKDELIEDIKNNIDGITSIVQNINSAKTNVVLGRENITLFGKPEITDYIGEFKFKISPLSFFQVNPIQTEVLYNKALEYADLNGNETVFDAYCGTGTISLFLSRKAKMVYGVEIVEAAIEDAKHNAEVNNVDNVEFFVGESERVIPDLVKKGIHADVVVVDPPRKGCGIELLKAISEMQPQRVVYVSCDPSTLARDLGILSDMGYKVMEIQPVDMFPQTAHVECVVLMSRVEK